ncbi:hypothetical protein ETB97_011714, partial [Aspergillus alliaceus]
MSSFPHYLSTPEVNIGGYCDQASIADGRSQNSADGAVTEGNGKAQFRDPFTSTPS